MKKNVTNTNHQYLDSMHMELIGKLIYILHMKDFTMVSLNCQAGPHHEKRPCDRMTQTRGLEHFILAAQITFYKNTCIFRNM